MRLAVILSLVLSLSACAAQVNQDTLRANHKGDNYYTWGLTSYSEGDYTMARIHFTRLEEHIQENRRHFDPAVRRGVEQICLLVTGLSSIQEGNLAWGIDRLHRLGFSNKYPGRVVVLHPPITDEEWEEIVDGHREAWAKLALDAAPYLRVEPSRIAWAKGVLGVE